MDQQIQQIDIFSGDPRLIFLAEMYKSSDPYDWYVPVVVVERPDVQQIFNFYIERNLNRVWMKSCWTIDHFITLLGEYLR